MNKIETLLERAIAFNAGPPPIFNGMLVTPDMEADFSLSYCIKIELRANSLGAKRWAIVDGRSVMNHQKGDWEYEPFPSSRSEAMVKRTRFNSVEEAFEYWQEWKREKAASWQV